jgi:hypothetical protein
LTKINVGDTWERSKGRRYPLEGRFKRRSASLNLKNLVRISLEGFFWDRSLKDPHLKTRKAQEEERERSKLS